MITLRTNLSSLIAQQSLTNSTNKLNQAIERMSTGYKINHAGDNAANYSISTNMSTQLSAYEVAQDNIAMGVDYVNTASDTLSLMQQRGQRLMDLWTQAQNGTYGQDSIDAINAEAAAIVDEINRMYANTEYNGSTILKRSYEVEDGMPVAQENGFIEGVTINETNGFLTDVDYKAHQVTVINPEDLQFAINDYRYIGIGNAETLAELSRLVREEGLDSSGKTIILTADIDLSGYDNWQAIGTEGNYFVCEGFYGNGHKISNLTIQNGNTYSGLFGNVKAGAIQDIGLENVNIIDCDGYTGGLVGHCVEVNINNCYVTGNISLHHDAMKVGGGSWYCRGYKHLLLSFSS